MFKDFYLYEFNSATLYMASLYDNWYFLQLILAYLMLFSSIVVDPLVFNYYVSLSDASCVNI